MSKDHQRGVDAGGTKRSEAREAIGTPMSRVDGRLKVTGGARYAAEYALPDMAHAVMITSTIARGRITAMDTSAAEKMPGVLTILTPFNAPKLPGAPKPDAQGGGAMRMPNLLQDDAVHFNGQPIGLAIADTFEHAIAAANAVHARYDAESPVLDMNSASLVPAEGIHPLGGDRTKERGNVKEALAGAPVKVTHTYTTPLENHNPMETHATTAVWDGDDLTLYESTQGIFSVRSGVAKYFGLAPEKVRVVSYFTGGGFGSKGGPWSHETLAAMAAREAKRPVKLVLTRRQMFGPVGGRALTIQHVSLGAGRDGKLVAIEHTSTSSTSTLQDFVEPSLVQTPMLYASPNMRTQYDLKRLNVGSPTFQRAPGESTGTFALESAMDELAYELGMDPLELRLRNYAERDPESGKPWSSKGLRECYQRGAERFGWSRRAMKPASMKDGGWLVGYGLATATYPARTAQASATARMEPDGRVLVTAGTQEIGCGTYTIMAQIAADALGVPVERVRFELGDTHMPETPPSVGSLTAASTGSAVHAAALALKAKLATTDVKNGPVEVSVTHRAEPSANDYSMHSFGAVFTEVRVDPQLGVVRIPRIVTVHDVGRVLNPKTAKSQIMGGVVWGIGMALLEETHIDPRTGRYVNAELAEYLVPVNADVGVIDSSFVETEDAHVNPIGVKGAGEIGITGVAASIANAVYHATGKRIRDLPIRVNRLLG